MGLRAQHHKTVPTSKSAPRICILITYTSVQLGYKSVVPTRVSNLLGQLIKFRKIPESWAQEPLSSWGGAVPSSCHVDVLTSSEALEPCHLGVLVEVLLCRHDCAIGDYLNLQPLSPPWRLGGGVDSSKLLIKVWSFWEPPPVPKLPSGGQRVNSLEKKTLFSPLSLRKFKSFRRSVPGTENKDQVPSLLHHN